ncbi:MAG: hypothetical protein JRJ20_15060 [Deltaproteobacteria bacterium]|nr:hypothetical protein [Deltaproteobacteria bacterium]
MLKRETDREWSKEELQKLHPGRLFDYAGRAIAYVEAKLNRIRVFGRYDYTEISNVLGPLENDETLISDKKNRNYDTKVIKEIKGFPDLYLTVLVNNKKPFSPQCSIEIHPRNDITLETHKAFLIWLNRRLPNLAVSKVEYVVDQFCVDHVGATILFWVDRRCFHLSYRKKGKILGDHRNHKDRSRSLGYKIGRYHRVYERGPESKKQGKDWFLKDVDRVRLEHTANRMKLKKYGINTLDDLMDNPRFSILNLHRWRFMQFLKSRKLPKFWQPHSTKDQSGHAGLFKLEAIRSRRKAENVAEYITNYKELLRIESRVNSAMKSFDLKWYNIS